MSSSLHSPDFFSFSFFFFSLLNFFKVTDHYCCFKFSSQGLAVWVFLSVSRVPVLPASPEWRSEAAPASPLQHPATASIPRGARSPRRLSSQARGPGGGGRRPGPRLLFRWRQGSPLALCFSAGGEPKAERAWLGHRLSPSPHPRTHSPRTRPGSCQDVRGRPGSLLRFQL